jgi:hypothetical protein
VPALYCAGGAHRPPQYTKIGEMADKLVLARFAGEALKVSELHLLR